jgi:hypothetical protein
MIRIRRFGVVRTATVAAVLYGLGSLIFFAILAVFFLIAGSSLSDVPGTNLPGFAIGAGGAIGILIGGVIFAAIYGVFGWIITAVLCLMYNVVAGMTGGIELQLEASPARSAPATPPAGWTSPAPAASPPAAPPAASPAAPTEPPTEPPAAPSA